MIRQLLSDFRRHDRGVVAAEFALVLPIFLLLVFGMMDVAGYAWRMNMAQKATQYGARLAVVTNPVVSALTTEDYVGDTVGGVTLSQGDVIPAAALGEIACSGSGGTPSCTCKTAPCPAPTMDTTGTAAFNRILARMRGIDPSISSSNLVVEYRGSGVGYAGDPYGMQIAPLTTVRLVNMQYRPWMGLLFSGGIGLPSVSYTLSSEDAQGTASN
jgi:hypothetical protein